MTLEVLKELFGVTHIGEEVPNTKPMRIGEEEVSLSQPITVVVPLEEEEDPVSQGPVVMVPPEEDEVLVPQAPPPSPSHQKEGDASLSQSLKMKALYRLGKFFALLFFSKAREILLALFSQKMVDL
jgi:hypothetical protein